MSVGGGVSTTNQTFSMDLSFQYLLNNYEAKDCKVVMFNFLVFGQNVVPTEPVPGDQSNHRPQLSPGPRTGPRMPCGQMTMAGQDTDC